MPYRLLLLLTLLASTTTITLPVTAKEYKGNKFKGTIESIGDSKLTLRDEDEESIEFFVLTQTDIQREEKPASLEDLQIDDVAIVTARRDGDRMVAVRIFAMEPK